MSSRPHRGSTLLVELDLEEHLPLGLRQNLMERLLRQGEQLNSLDLLVALEVVDICTLGSAQKVLPCDLFPILLIERGIQGGPDPPYLCPPERIDRLVPRDPDRERSKGTLTLEVLGRHRTPRLVDHIPGIDSSTSPHAQDGDPHQSPDSPVFLTVDTVRQLWVQWLVIHVKYLSQDRENRKRRPAISALS